MGMHDLILITSMTVYIIHLPLDRYILYIFLYFYIFYICIFTSYIYFISKYLHINILTICFDTLPSTYGPYTYSAEHGFSVSNCDHLADTTQDFTTTDCE